MPHVRALLPGCVVGREPGCVRTGWAAETIRDVCVRHWLREGAIRGPAFAPGASAASLGQRGSVERPLERDGLWTSVVEGHVASCLSSVRFSHETDRVGGIKPRTTHGEAFSLRPVVVVHREEREEEGPHRHCMLVNLFGVTVVEHLHAQPATESRIWVELGGGASRFSFCIRYILSEISNM